MKNAPLGHSICLGNVSGNSVKLKRVLFDFNKISRRD